VDNVGGAESTNGSKTRYYTTYCTYCARRMLWMLVITVNVYKPSHRSYSLSNIEHKHN